MAKDSENYSKKQTKDRFEAALRGAFASDPKPLKKKATAKRASAKDKPGKTTGKK